MSRGRRARPGRPRWLRRADHLSDRVPEPLIARADALRVVGHSWRQIGLLVGVRTERVRDAVVRARRRRRAGVGP
jgi:hypothetical protein